MKIMKIEITQERLDSLREKGITHLCVPSDSTPDRVEYIRLPLLCFRRAFFYGESRPYILPTQVSRHFKAVLLPEYMSDLPEYTRDEFIPSYAFPKSKGLIVREDGSIPDLKTLERKKSYKKDYKCPFCGDPHCSGGCCE